MQNTNNNVNYFSFVRQEKEKEKERGKWHEFNEDWGETFPGKTNPRPHVVDLATGKVRALRVPAHISFGQLRWLPDGRRLLAVGWETTERRLGTHTHTHDTRHTLTCAAFQVLCTVRTGGRRCI
jgi:integrase